MKQLFFVLVLFFGVSSQLSAQEVPPDQRFTTVELFAESATVAPGKDFSIAVKMTPVQGWHTYWINPGDAGMRTAIDWELPEGFTASEIRFPPPETFEFSELVNYGYGHSNTLVVDINVPDTLPEGPLNFVANAIWLVCDDAICVPEEEVLNFTLMPGDGAVDEASQAFFNEARSALPVRTEWASTFSVKGEQVDVFIPLPLESGDVKSAYIFPFSEDFLNHSETQKLRMVDGGFTISTKLGFEAKAEESLLLVLKTGDDNPIEAFEFTTTQAQGGAVAATSSNLDGLAGEELGLASILLFAVLGGAILNLMPCVFPVLSLKALSLAKTNGDEKAARESGVYYTLGILVSFAVVAAILLAVRGAGSAVGWGFQLQSPIFVGLMALLMFAVALNLFGFFEIGGRLAGVGSDWLAKLDGKSEAFVTGTLATIVATPCTGPFMAPVLAYALTQSYVIALGVFLALGFGLALPFIILAFVPFTRSWMPRPGAWMQTFKQFLGFPMVATAIWLLYVLNSQAGSMAVFVALFAFMAIGVAVWAFKHVGESSGGKQRVWQVIALAGLILAVGLMAKTEDLSGGAVETAEADENVLVYSAEALDARLAAGEPTFLYFTADWCITCKVNERTALKTAAVTEAFQQAGVEIMVGDWTSRNDEIGAVLKRFGRVGVPLYVYFGPDGEEPVVLGQILTPGILTDLVKG